MIVRFTVPGAPQGKGRPRIVRIAGQSRMATPKRTAAYEGLIALAAQAAMSEAKAQPFADAVGVNLCIDCPVPASWSKKKRDDALTGRILPTTKPDTDNVVKAVYDGCNGVLWRDDVQVVEGWQRKRYSATPGVRVEVWSYEQPLGEWRFVQEAAT